MPFACLFELDERLCSSLQGQFEIFVRVGRRLLIIVAFYILQAHPLLSTPPSLVAPVSADADTACVFFVEPELLAIDDDDIFVRNL